MTSEKSLTVLFKCENFWFKKVLDFCRFVGWTFIVLFRQFMSIYIRLDNLEKLSKAVNWENMVTPIYQEEMQPAIKSICV